MVFGKISLGRACLRRISPVATQEQAPQIRHPAAEKRGQFRVRARGDWNRLEPGHSKQLINPELNYALYLIRLFHFSLMTDHFS